MSVRVTRRGDSLPMMSKQLTVRLADDLVTRERNLVVVSGQRPILHETLGLLCGFDGFLRVHSYASGSGNPAAA